MIKPTDTLCWECENAVPTLTTGCTWSRDLIPVEGWTAIPSTIKNYSAGSNSKMPRIFKSYAVRECPLYRKDEG